MSNPHPGPLVVHVALAVSPEFPAFLAAMAAESGEDPAEVVRKALGLLRIVRDARRAGNGIAIITPEFEVDQEITGY